MAIRIVRLGTPRATGEGLRLGTVRRPPRGVPKTEWASRDYFDVWLPDLSPMADTMKSILHAETPAARRSGLARFRREVQAHAHVLDLLAALSHTTSLSLGCYCEDESGCHRSVLRELLVARGADVV